MRILFVAMSESVTTARWVAQLVGSGWDVHLFPSRFPVESHPDLRGVTLHGVGLWRPAGLDASVRVAGLWPWRRGAYRVTQAMDRLRLGRNPVRLLARTVRRLRPDLVHTLETQHAGYLALDAREFAGRRFPMWVHSTWGSDLYHFRHDPAHRARTQTVLASCGALMCDCRRDIGLARELGFRGEVLGVFPGGGGYSRAEMARHRSLGPASSRRTVMVKGYQSERYGGRALVALQAVHRCADMLRDYDVEVYGATECVRSVAAHMAVVAGLRIRAHERLPHARVLDGFGRARVALALGTTDGTPNAMLEAMALGALPIQSDTVSIGEWIEDGRNGLLVPPEDPAAVEAALRRALTDDALVEGAAAINARIVSERAEADTVRDRVLQAYAHAVRCGSEAQRRGSGAAAATS